MNYNIQDLKKDNKLYTHCFGFPDIHFVFWFTHTAISIVLWLLVVPVVVQYSIGVICTVVNATCTLQCSKFYFTTVFLFYFTTFSYQGQKVKKKDFPESSALVVSVSVTNILSHVFWSLSAGVVIYSTCLQAQCIKQGAPWINNAAVQHSYPLWSITVKVSDY